MQAWYNSFMLKSFKIPKMRLYNVQCWYAKNACEIMQVVAYSETSAIERAKTMALVKGYARLNCDFVV